MPGMPKRCAFSSIVIDSKAIFSCADASRTSSSLSSDTVPTPTTSGHIKMSIFDAYDTEFSSLLQEIQKNIAKVRDQAGHENETPTAQDTQRKLIEGLLLQSGDLIKQMEIEARSSDAAARKLLNERVSQYKKAVQTVRSDYQSIQSAQEKSALMSTSKSSDQRQRLLDSNDRMQRQNEMISNAHKTLAETEEVGMEITAELSRNREKIESSRAKAAEYSGVTDSARRLIGSMSRRETRQKFLAIFILVVLVVVIVLMVHYNS